VNGVCNDLPGIRIVDLSNADVSRLPAHRISHRVGNALPFMGCENSFVPTFSLEPCRFINGKAGVVADLDALPVIDIFVSDVAPLARQINLSKGGMRGQYSRQQKKARAHITLLICASALDVNEFEKQKRTSDEN
jgi:hypothetical protein